MAVVEKEIVVRSSSFDEITNSLSIYGFSIAYVAPSVAHIFCINHHSLSWRAKALTFMYQVFFSIACCNDHSWMLEWTNFHVPVI